MAAHGGSPQFMTEHREWFGMMWADILAVFYTLLLFADWRAI
jgi:hypothetical protein